MKILLIEEKDDLSLRLADKLEELDIEFKCSSYRDEEILENLEKFSSDLIVFNLEYLSDKIQQPNINNLHEDYKIPILAVGGSRKQIDKFPKNHEGVYTELFSSVIKLYAAIVVAIEKYKFEKIIWQRDRNIAATLHQMTDGLLTTDEFGNILRINDAALTICGYKNNEYLDCDFANYFRVQFLDTSGEFRHPFKAAMEMETRFESNDPVRFINLLDQTYYITFRITPFLDPSNKIIGYAIVISDVTESYLNELELMKSEKLYREVVENASDLISTTDLTGTCTYINSAVLKLTGYRKHEFLGKQLFKFVNPAHREAAQAFVIEFLESDLMASTVEFPIYKKNGEEIWLSHNITVMKENGEKVGFHVISHDVTERVKALNISRGDQQKLRQIIDAIPDSVFLKNTKGKFVVNNKVHLESLGLKDQSESLGKSNFDFMERSKAEDYQEEENAIINSGKPIINKIEKDFYDDRIEWKSVSKIPFKCYDGSVKGIVGIIRDISHQVEAEEKIKESFRQFHTLANVAPVVIYRTNKDGEIIYVNDKWVKISGTNKEFVVGRSFWEFIHDDDLERARKNIFKTINSRIQSRLDFRLKTNIDKEIWVMCNFVAEYNEENEIIGYAGTLTDITERKKNEFEILMLADALKSINDCVSITDLQNNIIFVNDAFVKTFGYSRDELIGQNIMIVVAFKDENFINKQLIDKTLNEGWSGELLNRKKNGKIFPIQLSTTSIRDKNGEPIGLIGVSSDITHRKKYEAELIRLNQAIIQSPLSIVITNLNGEIEFVNPKTLETNGYSREELIGQNPRIFSNGDNPPELYEDLWATITSGNEWHGRIHNKKKDGTPIWEQISISPILDSSGKLLQYIAFREDITVYKDLERNLIEAKEKAEIANEVKDAFIANISHEVRTPLNGILGMISLLKDSFDLDEDGDNQFIFDSIKRSSDRLIRTVDLILNYSRLQAGDTEMNVKRFKINELLNDLIIEFSFPAQQKGLSISYENKIGDYEIDLQFESINQILSNLIDNAIKYTVEGSIKIILDKNENGKINIDIIDTGIGISEDYMDKLFEPYTQEENGYKRSYDGVGLGLSLVNKLIGQMNGEILLSSKKNEGTKFTVIV